MLDKTTKLAIEEYANNLRYEYFFHKGKLPDFTSYEGLSDFISFYKGEILFEDLTNSICILKIINKDKFQIIIDQKQKDVKKNLIALTLLCEFLQICEENKNITNKYIEYNNKLGKIRKRKSKER